jgi:hypothetical protein
VALRAGEINRVSRCDKAKRQFVHLAPHLLRSVWFAVVTYPMARLEVESHSIIVIVCLSNPGWGVKYARQENISG